MRLFLLSPEIIFAARVNQASFTYPLGEVTFDGVTTGAYTDVLPGMTVCFGSSAGADDYGRQRIRKAATSETLYVGRSSRGIRDGEVDLADDCYISVLDDYRVWSKIPYASVSDDDPPQTTWYKDHDIAVGTYTTNPPPVANCGPGLMATIDDNSSLITVDFDASNSFAMAGSLSTYLWDVGDGSITVGTSASATITATFPAGFRWVSLTVTDSNGNSHTARCPVYARDPADDETIDAFEITSHRINAQGQTLSVRIRQDIAASDYPDGTLAMIADGEPEDAEDRTHMLFLGWHQNDPASIQASQLATLKDTTLQLVDVAGRLKSLPAFSQEVTVATTPADWDEMTVPTHDKYVHYLVHWHSTALDLADYTDTGTGASFAMIDFASSPGNVFDQVNERCNALEPDYFFTCNTLGQLRQIIDPMLQDSGDRTSTVQTTIDEDEWSSISYTGQRPPTVAMIQHEEAVLVSASEVDVVFGDAPGSSPGQGAIIQSHGNQLAPSQAILNKVVGHRYARINAPESHFMVGFAAGDDLDIEPADMTWVQLTMGADYAAQRGLNFTAARGLPHEISISYEHGRTGLVRTLQLEWERETAGTPGVTYTPPESDYEEPDDLAPGMWQGNRPVADTGTGTGIWYGDIGAYVMWDGAHIYRTMDFSATSPTWEFVDTGITGRIFDCKYVVANNTVALWALTQDGMWLCDDILATTPSWTLKLSNAYVQSNEDQPAHGYTLICSFATWGYDSNFIVAASGGNGMSGADEYQHAYFYTSSNMGDTWTAVDIGPDFLETAYGQTQAPYFVTLRSMEMYRDADGIIYCARGNQLILGNQRVYVFMSDDFGVTWSKSDAYWSHYASPSFMGILHPYPSRDDPCWMVSGQNTVTKLYMSDDEFATSSAVLGGGIPTAAELRVAHHQPPNSDPSLPDHAIVWVYTSDSTCQLYETFDKGANWEAIYDSGLGEQNVYYPEGYAPWNPYYSTPNGWPADSDQWIIVAQYSPGGDVSNCVLFTDDHFDTVVSKEGNLYTLLGGDNWQSGYPSGGIALPKVGVNA